MARTDDDVWDINESVGATALGVAAGRAAETRAENPLITDPFADLFLEAAGEGVWNVYRDGAWPAELLEADPQFPERMRAMTDYTASRTLFFDEFFLDAARAGVTQAVILAAGLDARAWRLAWPDGSVVFEIDQPKVLEFKAETLTTHGATPVARYVGVAVDLRQDWPKALREAGFDPAKPTAWSAEGLLPYLTAEAQDGLLEQVHALSAPDSRIAVEAFTDEFYSAESAARRQEQMKGYRSAAATLGTGDLPDTADLFYEGKRADVVDWLRARDWEASGIPADELMAGNGRGLFAEVADTTPQSVFVEGRLS